MPDKQSLYHLALSYWRSGSFPIAWVLTLLVIFCTGSLVIITLLLNQWQSGFYQQLQYFNFAGFTRCLLEFLGLSAIFVFATAYQNYLKMLLQIRWRQWLTRQYLERWLSAQTYYRLNLAGLATNPEQRISEDVHLFISHSLDLALGLLRHGITLLVFSAVLWQMSGILAITVFDTDFALPGYLLWLALLYSALGTWFMLKAGRPLVARNMAQQTNEANFRACLSRIREHDECVALYKGEDAEVKTINRHLQTIVANYLSIALSTRKITFLSTGYSQLSVVFAFLAASPRYFHNDIQLGQLFEISGAYYYVHSALSYFVDSFGKFAFWKAVAHRIENFRCQMSNSRQLMPVKGKFLPAAGNSIHLKNVTVITAGNQSLIENLSIDLPLCSKLLINGATGSGKSTLLKTIAGIWPYFSGSISKPAGHSLLFLPQKPYLPPGTLRQTLLYPDLASTACDQRLETLLDLCCLGSLTGHLDRDNDWEKQLSLGEQQCLAFIRVLLQKPDWLFLDEATSSLDIPAEENLYRLLKDYLPQLGLVSVGHRDTLTKFHTVNLCLTGFGSWTISPIGPEKSHAANRSRSC